MVMGQIQANKLLAVYECRILWTPESFGRFNARHVLKWRYRLKGRSIEVPLTLQSDSRNS